MQTLINKVILGILLGCAVVGAYFIYSEIYTAEAQDVDELSFVVNEGESVAALATRLEEEGVIRSENIFRKYIAWKKLDKRIHVGEFTVKRPVTIARVAEVLKEVASQQERTITIIPGWTLRDIAAYFEKEGIANKKEVYALLGEPAKDYRKGGSFDGLENNWKILKDKPDFVSYDGYIAPETYRVYETATLIEIIEKLVTYRDGQVTDQMYADIKKAGRTPYEVMTVASLLEKEVRGQQAKKQVADIFWRRYDLNWALQADSTVHYAVGSEGGSVFTSDNDRESKSLWNTYKYPGLPLGPISNPSLESIMAAIYPEKNDYWYFVTTLDTGEVKFGRTLEDHNANVYRYLR